MSAVDNDAFRTSMKGGKIIMTTGVRALPDNVRVMVLARVALYDAFDAFDTEHDFGSFDLAGDTYAFKIDEINGELVMTVMRLDEY